MIGPNASYPAGRRFLLGVQSIRESVDVDVGRVDARRRERRHHASHNSRGHFRSHTSLINDRRRLVRRLREEPGVPEHRRELEADEELRRLEPLYHPTPHPLQRRRRPRDELRAVWSQVEFDKATTPRGRKRRINDETVATRSGWYMSTSRPTIASTRSQADRRASPARTRYLYCRRNARVAAETCRSS